MKIEKKFPINASIEKVWSILTEPQLIAQCIPGCQSVSETSPNNYKASVGVEVGPIKTVFNVNITEIERDAPNYAIYDTQGDEGGRASSVKATSKLALTALSDSQTEVCVTSDFNIVGRLGKFGSGMMNKIIDTMSADTISALATYVETGKLPTQKKGPNKLTVIFWVAIALGLLITIGIVALVV